MSKLKSDCRLPLLEAGQCVHDDGKKGRKYSRGPKTRRELWGVGVVGGEGEIFGCGEAYISSRWEGKIRLGLQHVLEQTCRDEMVSTMPSFVRHCLPVAWPKRSRNLRQGAFICLGQSDVALMGLCPLFVVAVLRASMREHLSSQMKLSALSHHRL